MWLGVAVVGQGLFLFDALTQMDESGDGALDFDEVNHISNISIIVPLFVVTIYDIVNV